MFFQVKTNFEKIFKGCDAPLRRANFFGFNEEPEEPSRSKEHRAVAINENSNFELLLTPNDEKKQTKRQNKTQCKQTDTYIHSFILTFCLFIIPPSFFITLHRCCVYSFIVIHCLF